jgi:hypothetical protein
MVADLLGWVIGTAIKVVVWIVFILLAMLALKVLVAVWEVI